jgi:sortase (surface protein transpeptidase)
VISSSRWHQSRPVRAPIAVGLAIAGVVLLWAALVRPATPDSALAGAPDGQSGPSTSPSTAQPTRERPTAASDEPDVRDRVTGLRLPESDPVAVSIPSIGVRSTLVELGLKKDGSMEVPDDPAEAGWFNGGPTPGALGPAVIAGHVSWNGTPGVFQRLGTLSPGDRVAVARKDGKTALFTVSGVEQFPQSRFPEEAVYGPINHAGLRLITCGGTYDTASKSYRDNIVVFAKLEAVRPGG